MRNGKKVPHFFPNTVPAPEEELLGTPGSSPVLQEADGCRFTQIPSGRKTASFFCPNHRRISRRRIAACVFIESPRSLSASGETSVTGAGGTCPGAEKPRRASSPTPVNTEKRFPGSHRRLSSEAMRQQTLLPRNRRYGNKNGKCPGFLKGRQPLPPRHRFRKFAWPRKKPSLSPASLSGALYLGLYKNA